jgi:hypothetical protein
MKRHVVADLAWSGARVSRTLLTLETLALRQQLAVRDRGVPLLAAR